MMQSAPMSHGPSSATCTTVPSWMLVRAPTVTGRRSPRSTLPYQIETSSPSVTSPTTAAPGKISARSPIVGSNARYRSMIARGKRRRSSATRASSAAASGSGPSTTLTDVAIVVIALPVPALGADQPQLAQARRLLDGDRVDVREAGVAEAFLRPLTGAVDGFVQPFQRQVAQRIGAHELPDLVGRARRRDQLLARGRVDAVVTGTLRRRRADAHVHLARARAPDHLDDLARRRAAHDRIVDHDHALAVQHLAHRRQLQLHAEVADLLRRLDERPPHVVRAHQTLVVRDAALARVANGGGDARVGDGDDD